MVGSGVVLMNFKVFKVLAVRTISPACFDYSEEMFSFNGLTNCKHFDYP